MRQRHREADSNTSEVGRSSFLFRDEQNRRGYGDPKVPLKPYDIVRPPFECRREMEFRHCKDTVSSSQAKCDLCICRLMLCLSTKLDACLGSLLNSQ